MRMYIGIDVGGTKTLVAMFTTDGEPKKTHKFPTPKDYAEFPGLISASIDEVASGQPITAAGICIPGAVDRTTGVGIAFGNLPWQNVSIRGDVAAITNTPVAIENDAKAGGFYEASQVADDYAKVLYIAIGTGIGVAYVVNGTIDQNISDIGGRGLMVQQDAQNVSWETTSSGKAIVSLYGKRASDITSPETWQTIAKSIADELIDLIALLQPEVIVFGGGVGEHFEHFATPLKSVLAGYKTPLLQIPDIKKAAHPEEAAIYGCYLLAKELA